MINGNNKKAENRKRDDRKYEPQHHDRFEYTGLQHQPLRRQFRHDGFGHDGFGHDRVGRQSSVAPSQEMAAAGRNLSETDRQVPAPLLLFRFALLAYLCCNRSFTSVYTRVPAVPSNHENPGKTCSLETRGRFLFHVPKLD